MPQSGRHFLQIPGPTNVPDRILRAISQPTIDHRGPEFAALATECLEGMKPVFQTTAGRVFIYPASGTGAWEAAIVNTLSPGDRVLMFDNGHFAGLWRKMAESFGVEVNFLSCDWRRGIDPSRVEEALAGDSERKVRAVMCVHNESSTGVASRIDEIRKAIDAARHPALFMVDVVSSLACLEFQFDAWGVDVAVATSQKGLMLPPGLGMNAVSGKALAASKAARLPRSFWSWDAMANFNKNGFFPYTPATNLLFGLREAIRMLVHEEGLANVVSRHGRFGEATRRAVRGWGLETYCLDPRCHSNSLTGVLMPEGWDEAGFRRLVLEEFDMSLGAGLSKLAGKVFRIGHLGSFNDLMLCGALSGVEMGLTRFGVPHRAGGVAAALEFLGGGGSPAAPQP
jgi:alanine-glyoxylate transaminase/serine-glyoxylate transaminase/serine-pyruvate transaminase